MGQVNYPEKNETQLSKFFGSFAAFFSHALLTPSLKTRLSGYRTRKLRRFDKIRTCSACLGKLTLCIECTSSRKLKSCWVSGRILYDANRINGLMTRDET